MRSLSIAIAALTGFSVAPLAAPLAGAQQTRSQPAASTSLIIVDCQGDVDYTFTRDGAPAVRCELVPARYSSQTFDLNLPQYQSFGLSQASVVDVPSWILYAHGSEGVCALSFTNPVSSGDWPDETSVMFWSAADIAARRQPRAVRPADLQERAPNCTHNLLAFHDRVMESLNPGR